MDKDAIIIFLKNPIAGKVKTRLAATMGNSKALEIYLILINHTLKEAGKTVSDIFIYFSDEIDTAIGQNGLPFIKKIQSGGNLGNRMKNAFQEVFDRGYTRVVIIGTDCPGIDAGVLQSALFFLPATDIVIGPAIDGGYYLLGMKKAHPCLFENINWGTPAVLEATKKSAVENGLSYKLLQPLADVDEEKDLIHFYTLLLNKHND